MGIGFHLKADGVKNMQAKFQIPIIHYVNNLHAYLMVVALIRSPTTSKLYVCHMSSGSSGRSVMSPCPSRSMNFFSSFMATRPLVPHSSPLNMPNCLELFQFKDGILGVLLYHYTPILLYIVLQEFRMALEIGGCSNCPTTIMMCYESGWLSRFSGLASCLRTARSAFMRVVL